jgi:hypothetical protein
MERERTKPFILCSLSSFSSILLLDDYSFDVTSILLRRQRGRITLPTECPRRERMSENLSIFSPFGGKRREESSLTSTFFPFLDEKRSPTASIAFYSLFGHLRSNGLRQCRLWMKTHWKYRRHCLCCWKWSKGDRKEWTEHTYFVFSHPFKRLCDEVLNQRRQTLFSTSIPLITIVKNGLHCPFT